MTVPAWDLDAPVETPLAVGGGGGLGPLLAVCLAGLGLGGLLGSALNPAAAPRFPPTATLSVREVYVNAVEPGPPASSTAGAGSTAGASATSGSTASTPPSARPVALKGKAGVVLRLQVANPAAASLRLTALRLDGVTGAAKSLPLDLLVAGHQSAAVDVQVHPDCTPGRKPTAVRARLTGPPGSGLDGVQVSPSRALIRPGGLCSQLDSDLPNGWRTPLLANTTRPDGGDLEVTVDELSDENVVGLTVDGQLQPTVFAGEDLLDSTAQLEPGAAPRLRLHGPPPCSQPGSSTPIPSTLRLLVQGDEGIQQRLVIVGPALTRWLQLDCGR